MPVSAISVGRIAGSALVVSLLAGCSSDVLRFQDGFYAGADSLTTASVPTPQADVQGAQAQGVSPNGVPVNGGNSLSQPYPGDTAGGDRYAVAPTAAPFVIQSSTLAPPQRDTLTTGATPQPSGQTAATRPEGWSSVNAPRVRLEAGETIYSVSRRYGVPVDAIMKANNITDPTRVSPGQQLVIPGYSRGGTEQVAGASQGQGAGRSLNEQAALLAGEASPGLSYTVESGDTLGKIAGEAGISVTALRQANGLTSDVIRVGQALKLPRGGAETAATAAPVAQPTDPQQTNAVQQANLETQSMEMAATDAQPKPAGYTAPVQQKESSIADQVGTDMAAIAPESTGIEKLRWPVRGQIVTPFGTQDGNVRNDGVDILVPEGTEIKAAENGVVIYAGSGLKEYGNTVLVRHDNGLVTVYGHAKNMTVERGDKVSRGQTIAHSGMTGTAERPKLHFEVRENATPVNPTTFLE